jgi:hypothetical protein
MMHVPFDVGEMQKIIQTVEEITAIKLYTLLLHLIVSV